MVDKGKTWNLNLGCGDTRKVGMIGIDRFLGGQADILADASHLPFQSNSVDVIFASHVIEHVLDLHALMTEIHRVLRPGGRLIAMVPFGLQSLYDPFHLHAFNEGTFLFFARGNNGSTSLQRFALFDVESTRLDSITQFLRFIPKLVYAIESRPKVAWMMSRAQQSSLFRILPKGRWPQLIVTMRKPMEPT